MGGYRVDIDNVDKDLEDSGKRGSTAKRQRFENSGLHKLRVTEILAAEYKSGSNKGQPYLDVGLEGSKGEKYEGKRTRTKVDYVGEIPAKGQRPARKKIQFLMKFLRSSGLTDEQIKAALPKLFPRGEVNGEKVAAMLTKSIVGKDVHANLVRAAFKSAVYSEPSYFVTPEEFATAVKDGTALQDPEDVEAEGSGDDDGSGGSSSSSGDDGDDSGLF